MNDRTRLVLASWAFWGPLGALFFFYRAQNHLLQSGFLNTRDLGFVGGEEGSFWEYLTNVWYWDAFGGLLMLAVLVGTIMGVALLIRSLRDQCRGMPSASARLMVFAPSMAMGVLGFVLPLVGDRPPGIRAIRSFFWCVLLTFLAGIATVMIIRNRVGRQEET